MVATQIPPPLSLGLATLWLAILDTIDSTFLMPKPLIPENINAVLAPKTLPEAVEAHTDFRQPFMPSNPHEIGGETRAFQLHFIPPKQQT